MTDSAVLGEVVKVVGSVSVVCLLIYYLFNVS